MTGRFLVTVWAGQPDDRRGIPVGCREGSQGCPAHAGRPLECANNNTRTPAGARGIVATRIIPGLRIRCSFPAPLTGVRHPFFRESRGARNTATVGYLPSIPLGCLFGAVI